MVKLQADVTAGSADHQALLKRFRLFGPPGIIFFDPAGREIQGLRVIGFQAADKFSTVLDQALGLPGIQYDARRFQWIGSPTQEVNVAWTWQTSKVKSLDDARRIESVMGTTGPGSASIPNGFPEKSCTITTGAKRTTAGMGMAKNRPM
jgi:hypothetical protein